MIKQNTLRVSLSIVTGIVVSTILWYFTNSSVFNDFVKLGVGVLILQSTLQFNLWLNWPEVVSQKIVSKWLIGLSILIMLQGMSFGLIFIPDFVGYLWMIAPYLFSILYIYGLSLMYKELNFSRSILVTIALLLLFTGFINSDLGGLSRNDEFKQGLYFAVKSGILAICVPLFTYPKHDQINASINKVEIPKNLRVQNNFLGLFSVLTIGLITAFASNLLLKLNIDSIGMLFIVVLLVVLVITASIFGNLKLIGLNFKTDAYWNVTLIGLVLACLLIIGPIPLGFDEFMLFWGICFYLFARYLGYKLKVKIPLFGIITGILFSVISPYFFHIEFYGISLGFTILFSAYSVVIPLSLYMFGVKNTSIAKVED